MTTEKRKFWDEVLEVSYAGPFGPPQALMLPLAIPAVALLRAVDRVKTLRRK